MPDPGTIFGFALVGALAACVARLYLRDARAYRAGRGDERYAWLRRSHPNHPALPAAPPKRILRALPQRWGWRHAVIAAVQVAVIGGLLWLCLVEPWRSGEKIPPNVIPIVIVASVIIVAFGTAVLTRLWDLSAGALARRRAGARQR